MNVTEAWGTVLQAAYFQLADGELPPAQRKELARAIKKTQPRVDRMYRRLDQIRAERAGRPTRPACLRD